MARPRTFDPDDILDVARDVFWRKGFQGASLDDITAESGLTKPSLYAAFGDKTSLYLKVLDRYHSFLLNEARHALSCDEPARAAIESWLIGFVPRCSGTKGRRGCLSVNTSTDGALDQAEVRKSVRRFNSQLEDLIQSRLEADRGQFSEGFDPAAVAQTILAVYSGLMVQARQAPEAKTVKTVIGQITKLLA